MATSIVADSSANPNPAPAAVALDQFQAQRLALHLGLILKWIADAKYILEDIRLAAEISPELATLLKSLHVTYCPPDWVNEEQTALSEVMAFQHDCIMALAVGGV